MAFSKKAIEQRKDWLTNWMEEGKRRKELGLPEIYLYEKDTRAVSYADFINKELVLFSNCDNERSIPSLVVSKMPLKNSNHAISRNFFYKYYLIYDRMVSNPVKEKLCSPV